MNKRYDVAIVGAGMVGATLAVLLGKARFQVALIEAGAESTTWSQDRISSRVSALTTASKRLFESLGLWESVAAKRVSAYYGMQVWDAEGTGEVCFTAEEIGSPDLGHIVENDAILDSVRAEIANLPNVDILYNTHVKTLSCTENAQHESECSLTLSDSKKLTSSLVVAADGARSPLRRLMGIEVNEWDTNQSAIVTTVLHQYAHDHVARQAFLSTGPLAFLPLDAENGHCASIVWSADQPEADRLMALEDDAFAAAMTRAFESRLGAVTQVGKRHRFPLVQRHAVTYTLPGFALVGDAAHSIHPLAGQGVNLGFLDVAVLAETLEAARTRGVALGNGQMLSRYARQRRADNAVMLGAMAAFCRGFGSRNPWVRVIRNVGLRSVNRLQPIKRLLMRQALGGRTSLPMRMR